MVETEEELWEWLHQQCCADAAELPPAAAGVPGLPELAAIAARDEFRDIAGSAAGELSCSIPELALRLLIKIIQEQPVSVPAAPCLAALYKVAWAVLSTPEWSQPTAAALSDAAGNGTTVSAVLSRLHKCSETALIASEKVAFTGGSVSELSVTPDAEQPRQGRVGERAAAPPPTVAPASLHAVRGHLPEQPPAPSKHDFDEPLHLRALLWAFCSAGGAAAVTEALLCDLRAYACTGLIPPLGPPPSVTLDRRTLAPHPLPFRAGVAGPASLAASSALGALPPDSLLALIEETPSAPTAAPETRHEAPAAAGAPRCAPAPFITPRHGAAALRTVLQLLFAALRARYNGVAAEVEYLKSNASGGEGGVPDDAEAGAWAAEWAAAARLVSDAAAAAVALHGTAGLYSETSSTFGVFHEPLTQVLFCCIDASEALRDGAALASAAGIALPAKAATLPCVRDGGAYVIARILGAIQGSWEEVRKGNSPKGCLFLLEVDQLLSKTLALDKRRSSSSSSSSGGCLLRQVVRAVVPILVDTFASDNSRLVQMGLAVFKHKEVVEAIVADGGEGSAGAARRPLVQALLTALVREGDLHWNATVNKQTHAALTALVEADPAAVAAEAEALFGSGSHAHASTPASSSASTAAPPAGLPTRTPLPTPAAAPPLTVTGVAPWASAGAGLGAVRPGPARGFGGGLSGGSAGAAPPVTITGVAPWAARGSAPVPTAAGGFNATMMAGTPRALAAVPATAAPVAASQREGPGMQRLRAHLDALLPPAAPVDPTMFGGRAGQAADATADPDALAPVPTLLPSLAFHDLVFGRELGTGSFSSVKYAKRIIRGLPASTWPEYAVKAISTRVMAELGYEPSVRREIAVLSVLTHPNVARLISAFRWREGAYLVLEHAGAGDLHSAITRLGSLEEGAARFLMAEVLAALHHVHERGFVYVDVKPENILLVRAKEGGGGSSSGTHAKLGDFGACRPITAAARAFIGQSTHILDNLRDGDWRAAQGLATRDAGEAAAPAAAPHTAGEAPASTLDGDDERIEGTEEYLAPELRSRTAHPSIASDAYAFGVTLYQVLCGRLPDPGAVEAHFASKGSDSAAAAAPPPGGAAAGRGVRFGRGKAGVEPLFGPDFPPAAQAVVAALLHPDPAARLGGGPDGLRAVMAHPWFAALGPPDAVCTLYSGAGPALAQGTAAPSTDPRWTRRHNSTMWAPLPAAVATEVSEAAGAKGSGAGARGSSAVTLRDLLRVGNVLPAVRLV